jgi:hypothetical protein
VNTPAVLLPAVAWLLGRGLISLVGALRKKLSFAQALPQGLIGLSASSDAAILYPMGRLHFVVRHTSRSRCRHASRATLLYQIVRKSATATERGA